MKDSFALMTRGIPLVIELDQFFQLMVSRSSFKIATSALGPLIDPKDLPLAFT
jgi:hypothetical protein